jgi:hypothetical protein
MDGVVRCMMDGVLMTKQRKLPDLLRVDANWDSWPKQLTVSGLFGDTLLSFHVDKIGGLNTIVGRSIPSPREVL